MAQKSCSLCLATGAEILLWDEPITDPDEGKKVELLQEVQSEARDDSPYSESGP